MKGQGIASILFSRYSREQPELDAVRRTLFQWLLLVFLLLGLPAVAAGIYLSYQQGRLVFAGVYALMYLLAVLDLVFSRKLPFCLSASVFIAGLFALAVSVFVRLGFTGAGLPLLIACCVLSTTFFDIRWGIGAILASTVAFSLVGVGTLYGIIPTGGALSLDPHAPLSWVNWGVTFFLLAVAMVIAPQTLRMHLEHSLAHAEKNAQRLEEENQNRRRAEEALRTSEEQYRLIVENASEAIFIAQDGVLKFPNPRTLALLRFSRDEISSIPFLNFVHPEDRPMVARNHEDRLRGTPAPTHSTFRIIGRHGEESWVELNAVRITWEGRPATLNFGRDITEEKRLEAQYQQAQKMEAVGTLAGGIAHDFNNLLQVIKGYAELLQGEAGTGAKASPELSEIRQSAERGSELARQLLTFSRKVESAFRPLDLNLAVRKACALLERVIARMIAIELRLAPGLKPVNADPGQIEQVLMNLAINARDAMPEGGTLSIGTANCVLDEEFCRDHLGLEPGPHVRLWVADSGVGMSRETLSRIFEPFFTTKGIGKGTGLGLAMVYGIVRNHRGTIAVESNPGSGACFTIFIPASTEAAHAEEGISDESLPGGTETILLVDDDDKVRALGERMLHRAGYSVLPAPDGEHALQLFGQKAADIDLVVLDMIMPGMGGMLCLEQLLKFDPAPKVLISSGYSPEGQARAALDAGAVGFVLKPYGRRTLLSEVRRALDSSAPLSP